MIDKAIEDFPESLKQLAQADPVIHAAVRHYANDGFDNYEHLSLDIIRLLSYQKRTVGAELLKRNLLNDRQTIVINAEPSELHKVLGMPPE